MSDRDCENCKHHTEKGCDSWDCNFERRMARKEAIKRLKVWLICMEECPEDKQCYDSYLHSTCEYTDFCDDVSINDAIRVAINSLEIDERYELEYEQIEPCEDAISRRAVRHILNHEVKMPIKVWKKVFKLVDDLPPVTPQVICPSHGVDCKDCPAINGEWVAKPDGRFIYAQCSNCGEIHDVASNYCPSCGCIMDKNDFNAYIKAESEE